MRRSPILRALARLAPLAVLLGTPALAQNVPEAPATEAQEGPRTRTGHLRIDPYVEASQIVSWELSPGNDVVTYTQLAAGVDASIAGRNNGGSISLRYERNFAWSRDGGDSDTLTGIAHGHAAIVPRTLTIEAGALASRTRSGNAGSAVFNPIIADGASAHTYSAYAGPNLTTRAGDVAIAANYRLGYTRVDGPSFTGLAGVPVSTFDESVSHSATVRAGTRPGEPLPVGVGVGAGFYQEDVNDLDQRVRDAYARADVTVPVTPALAVVAGIGVEDVEVSSRDALRDAAGNPVVGSDGRYVTDPASPRRIAYEADGLIWDVGVIWRPSRRTALEAHFGHRYDSETVYGNFTWSPSSRSNLSIGVYDGIQGFGGRLVGSLAGLPDDFTVIRDPVTGDITGCVSGVDGANCLDGLLGSLRASVFRGRGVVASYSHRVGRLTAALGAGYDRRSFIAAPGTVLAGANGVTDESWYLTGQLAGPVWRGHFTVNAFANWFDAGAAGSDVLALGTSAAYSQRIWRNLSARAAIALTMLDSDLDIEDTTTATALVGLRYDFW